MSTRPGRWISPPMRSAALPTSPAAAPSTIPPAFRRPSGCAYWEDGEKVHSALPSGQGDLTYSNTWGNDFGFVFLGSYYQRSSSTLNTYTLGYSYYPYSGSGTAANVPALDQASTTATSTTLKPSDSVADWSPFPTVIAGTGTTMTAQGRARYPFRL